MNRFQPTASNRRAHEGGSECRVSQSNFWQCRMSTWKWESQSSVDLTLCRPLLFLGLLKVKCRELGSILSVGVEVNFGLNVACRMKKWSNNACWNKAFMGPISRSQSWEKHSKDLNVCFQLLLIGQFLMHPKNYVVGGRAEQALVDNHLCASVVSALG